jgi:hypothetical protein
MAFPPRGTQAHSMRVPARRRGRSQGSCGLVGFRDFSRTPPQPASSPTVRGRQPHEPPVAVDPRTCPHTGVVREEKALAQVRSFGLGQGCPEAATEGQAGRERVQQLLGPTSFTQFAAHIEKDALKRVPRHRPSGQNSTRNDWPPAQTGDRRHHPASRIGPLVGGQYQSLRCRSARSARISETPCG